MDSDKVLGYLPNTYIEENLMQELALFQGNLLCSCAVYDPSQDMDTLYIRLIDLDSGNLICETQLSTSPSYPAVRQALSDKVVVTDDGHDQLYFWDLSLKMTGDSLDLTNENENVTGNVLAPSYYEEANKLSEKYDVTIKIADLCDTDYLDKTALQECNEEKVATGLSILKKAFSQYPEGFWNQLCYGSYRTIEIALTGKISNKEQIDGYEPTAFLQHNEDKITMVLNINESFATEDRATIFETAMAKNADIFSDASNPLWKKLSYYSKCIRDDFDTTGWPACTVWEEPIKETP